MEDEHLVEQFSCRVTKRMKNALGELKQAEKFLSPNQMLETLLENYYLPKQADKENLVKINALEAEIATLKNKLEITEEQNREFQEEQKKFSDINEDLNTAASELRILSDKNIELEQEKENLLKQMELPLNSLIVQMGELERRCLLYAAKRESVQRKKDIPAAAFILFLLMENLMKGNMYAFSPIPDRVINKYKKDIESGREYVYYE